MRFKTCSAAIVLAMMIMCFVPTPVAAQNLGITPTSGTVGSEVAIVSVCSYGTGDYFLYWGETQELIKQGTATGCPTITFSVPDAARGQQAVTLKINGKVYDGKFTVNPSINISPDEGTVGASVTVTGHGFAANESGIQISFNKVSVQNGINADRKGYWQSSFKVPQARSGDHYVDAFGVTAAEDIADVIFQVKPKIEINPTSGQVGTLVTVEGNGYGSSETDIKISYDELITKTAITSNSDGFWRSNFFVPPSTKGVHAVSAFGSLSSPGSSSGAIFTISPSIKLELSSGVLGATIKTGDSFWITGVGFVENESGIQVNFDGNMLSSNLIADAKGSWSVQVEVPLISQGKHEISAYGGTTRAGDVAPASLIVSPGIQINPIAGGANQDISIQGTGFGSSKNLIISFDGIHVGIPTLTDSKGTFSTTIKVPEAEGGDHLITCSDASAAVASATYNMESTAPQAPVLKSPAPGAEMGELGNTVVSFSWEPVNDPSGVSYTLELSRSPDFASVMLRKDGLTGTEYTLSKSEALINGEYFWRVNAIDGAMNESEWSAAQSFKIQGFEIFMLVAIVVVAVVVVGVVTWRIISITRKGGWK